MTPAARRAQRLVTVELGESEQIVTRGRRVVSYRVRSADGWIAAKDHPRATLERVESGPSTVWERIVRIELRVGDRVERVESEPAPELHRDALAHLLAADRPARRRTRRTLLVVGPRGELRHARDSAGKPAAEPPRYREARRGR